MNKTLDIKTTIKQIHKFYDNFKRKEIQKILHNGESVLHLSFQDLAECDIELAELLLLYPFDVITLMEQTIKSFYDSSYDINNEIKIRFTSLPETEKLKISEIRQKHLGKIILLEGLVKRKTEIQPRVKSINYLCTNPTCSFSEAKIKIYQFDEKASILKTCPKCKSAAELIEEVLVDSQNVVLDEDFDMLKPGQQPKSINVLLRDDDLVLPYLDSKINPGRKVQVIGIVNALKGTTKTGAESVNRTLVIDCNSINLTEYDEDEIKLTDEEMKEFDKIATREDVYEHLVSNTVPEIEGLTKPKEAGLLTIVGGNRIQNERGFKVRGDIHLLLIGDPSVAKSQFIDAILKLSSRSSKVTGKGASGVGITAAVVRDEITKSYALEAGPIVLASGGVLGLDEIDKFAEDDQSYLLEAMEQQTVTIAKANIRATLRAETAIIAGANPKFGRFDPFGSIAKQINFPAPLISRFDLIFVLKDIPDKKRDELIGEKILSVFRGDHKSGQLSVDFLKRYLSYAKRITPILTKEMTDKLKDYYIKTRSQSYNSGEIKAIAITPRQLGALVRLSTAYAKLSLSKKVEEKHILRAIKMFQFALEGVGYDSDSGTMDVDRIMTGVTAASRNKFKIIRDIIDRLEQEKPEIIHDDVSHLAEKENIKEKELKEILDKLKSETVIYEPRKGIYKKLE